MPAEAGLHGTEQLVPLGGEGGVGHLGHHAVLEEPAQVAALVGGAVIRRALGRQVGEGAVQTVGARALELGEDVAGRGLVGQQDLTRSHRRAHVLDLPLVVPGLDRLVGDGVVGHLGQQLLGEDLARGGAEELLDPLVVLQARVDGSVVQHGAGGHLLEEAGVVALLAHLLELGVGHALGEGVDVLGGELVAVGANHEVAAAGHGAGHGLGRLGDGGGRGFGAGDEQEQGQDEAQGDSGARVG